MASYSVDDVTLRDLPDDIDEAWARVRELENLGDAGGGERVAWLRMLGELTAAEELGWRMLAGRGGPRDVNEARRRPNLGVGALGHALRLADVLQWQGRFADAEDLFVAAIASAESLADTAPSDSPIAATGIAMTAFGYQHLGKSRFDEARYREAGELFERALAIRQTCNAPADQIASTVQAIAAVRSRLT